MADGEDGFVVLDTAPTGHTLLLLDSAEAYHREVGRTNAEVPRDVAELLPRLRDPGYTRVLIVTLPEATPVHEAERLAADLGRAGIAPFAWVVNQSLSLAGVSDPTLRARADREHALIDEVRAGAARHRDRALARRSAHGRARAGDPHGRLSETPGCGAVSYAGRLGGTTVETVAGGWQHRPEAEHRP